MLVSCFFCAITAFAQQPVKDTAKPKIFYLILQQKQWEELIFWVKHPDKMPPSSAADWSDLITANLQELKPEAPKKDSTSK